MNQYLEAALNKLVVAYKAEFLYAPDWMVIGAVSWEHRDLEAALKEGYVTPEQWRLLYA